MQRCLIQLSGGGVEFRVVLDKGREWSVSRENGRISQLVELSGADCISMCLYAMLKLILLLHCTNK